MYTDILINASFYENRIALLENGNLVEFHLERPAEKGLIGNIYCGRVVRVLPGMQAAFVEIGLERTGFLYVDDVHPLLSGLEHDFAHPEYPCDNGDGTSGNHEREDQNYHGDAPAINDLLQEGQEILVQIVKEPLGSKGARLTCHITLPCRNLVFMPMTDHIGISLKIKDEAVRERLRDKVAELRPPGTGFVVRTVAEYVTEEELEGDMEFLMLLWDDIRSIAGRTKAPGLVYKDLDMVLRSVRDLFTRDVDRLIIDSAEGHQRLLEFVRTFAPEMQDKILLYEGETPLFETHGIEHDISRAVDKKVWLRSGGYIIIDSTEALTVIDVNTGRYTGKNDLAETIFKTNIEAVKEIAYQLRLRNIGGIIIIDFIDMETEEHRQELFAAFQEAVSRDKKRINILAISEFGLVQMTRKRSCENLSQMLNEPCHYCGGEGMVKSRRSVCYEIFRKISRDVGRFEGDTVQIRVNPRVANMLFKEEAANVDLLEKQCGKRCTILPVRDFHQKQYELSWEKQ